MGVPLYTEDEHEFAQKLSLTYEGNDSIPGIGSGFDDEYAKKVMELYKNKNRDNNISRFCGMNDFLLPHYMGDAFESGSTDVGDVSWNCPTAQIHVAAWPNGCPGHSWQNVSSAGSSIGHKAALHAGKVLCAAAIDLYENEELINKSREEFKKRTASGYICPIPDDAILEAAL